MSDHVRNYHLALEKVQTAPLTLSERDFDVLQAFNPADAVRGRAALRQAQLALVPKAEMIRTTAVETILTKAVDPPPAPSPLVTHRLLQKVTDRLFDTLEPVLASYQKGLADQKQAIQDLKTANADLRERVAHLEGRQRGLEEAALERAR